MNHGLVTQVTLALYSSAMLLVLWYLGHLWRDYRIQAFRQDLFEVRGQLFEYARTGTLRFDDPLYRAFRTHVNALIRYGYHVNFSTLVTTLVLRALKKTVPDSSLLGAINRDTRLTVEQREALLALYNDALWACVRQIGLTSFFAWPCAVFLFLWLGIKTRFNRLWDSKAAPAASVPGLPQTMVRHVQHLESQAVESEREREACMASA